MTAAEVAAELEVSVATARRDLEALSAAGVPVYPQPGRGGGWSLVGGARTDLSGLTAAEAQALFLLAGPAASTAPRSCRSALRKLVRALPGTFRADAEAAADAVVVDPARWGERGTGAGPRWSRRCRPPWSGGARSSSWSYARRASRPATPRLVDPWGLVDKDDVWYLIAGTERGQRTFRVDRIIDAVVTDEPAERPADFELAAGLGARSSTQVEQRRALVSATVLIEARFVPVLHDHFGRHCEVVDAGR